MSIDEILADPKRYKRESIAEMKREHPEMTDEQIEWSYRFAVYQFFGDEHFGDE